MVSILESHNAFDLDLYHKKTLLFGFPLFVLITDSISFVVYTQNQKHRVFVLIILATIGWFYYHKVQ